MKRLALILWRMSKTDLRMLWFALRHPHKPVWLVPATVLLALYAISPLSYAIPFVGLADDLIVVPMLLHFLLGMLPETLKQGMTPQGATMRRRGRFMR
jgi:uncharacterized membrane protein YkvA (DUF1232 family)